MKSTPRGVRSFGKRIRRAQRVVRGVTGKTMLLVLASQSPRRRELLTLAGFQFTVRARPVEERRGLNEAPRDYVVRLAREKAEAAWEGKQEVVLGADTTVVLGDRVLEKPKDLDEAREMLRALSGARHTVMTGICLRGPAGAVVDCESTHVTFAEMSLSEIEDYVGTGEPMDKAGAYAIQGLASKFVERIEGCYFNVMGLPLALFYRHWKTVRNNTDLHL
jgi:septum formation protein